MSWRERLQYGHSLRSDRSDRSPAASTFVTSVTTSVDPLLAACKSSELTTEPLEEIMPIPATRVDVPGEDPTPSEALCEIGGLLATAYQRLSAIRRVGSDSGERELAISDGQSVHGVVA